MLTRIRYYAPQLMSSLESMSDKSNKPPQNLLRNTFSIIPSSPTTLFFIPKILTGLEFKCPTDNIPQNGNDTQGTTLFIRCCQQSCGDSHEIIEATTIIMRQIPRGIINQLRGGHSQLLGTESIAATRWTRFWNITYSPDTEHRKQTNTAKHSRPSRKQDNRPAKLLKW